MGSVPAVVLFMAASFPGTLRSGVLEVAIFVAQLVETWPSMLEGLGSIPTTAETRVVLHTPAIMAVGR